MLTNKCNLSCKYCWVHWENNVGQNQILDLDFAKKGLEDFYNETGLNYIGFFAAGEPTLEMNLINEIYDHAKHVMGEVKVELQSNGFFNFETLDWIYNHVNILWISADGPLNDKYRLTKNEKGSNHIIERNINKLASLNKENNKVSVGIRSTIGKFNVFQQKELIDYYYNLGIKAIYVDQICAPVGKMTNDSEFGHLEPMVFAEEFFKAYNYAKSIGLFYGTLATVNFDEEVTIPCRSAIPAPHLTPSGLVTGCEMCSEEGTPLDMFIYGRWNKDLKTIEYDQDKINNLRTRNIHNLKECQDCEYIKNCAGQCAGEGVNETGDLYKPNRRLCEAVKYLASRIERNNGIYPYLHS